MKWYDDLYVGQSILHKKNKVKWKIVHNAGQVGVYVIALASNPDNLLDIIPSWALMQKGYLKKNLSIVGLAKGYDEAVETAVAIVDEVYRRTGAFRVADYLMEKQEARSG